MARMKLRSEMALLEAVMYGTTFLGSSGGKRISPIKTG